MGLSGLFSLNWISDGLNGVNLGVAGLGRLVLSSWAKMGWIWME